MGESTLVKMNDSGMVTIPQEVRQVLGIDGEEAILRLNNIEVADTNKIES